MTLTCMATYTTTRYDVRLQILLLTLLLALVGAASSSTSHVCRAVQAAAMSS